MADTVNEEDRVELVAKAIAKADGFDFDALAPKALGELDLRDAYRRRARAAIASLQGADTVTEEAIERRAKMIGDERRDPNWWRYKDEATAAMRAAAPTAQDDNGVRIEAQDDDALIEKIARMIEPCWFTEDGRPPLINNYPDQHLRYLVIASRSANFREKN